MILKLKTAKRKKATPSTLKQVQKFLSKIPDINEGGCGISALSIYRWLKKNEKEDNNKFIFLYRGCDEKEYLNNRKALRDNKQRAVAPLHCCILYEGKFIDCDGGIDIGKYNWVQIIDEEEFIKKAINNIGTWNDCFNRKHIGKIEKKLNIDLSDIEGKK